jgi:hypothetical protein
MSSTKWTSRLVAIGASFALIAPVVGSTQSLNDVIDAEKRRTMLAQ